MKKKTVFVLMEKELSKIIKNKRLKMSVQTEPEELHQTFPVWRLFPGSSTAQTSEDITEGSVRGCAVHHQNSRTGTNMLNPVHWFLWHIRFQTHIVLSSFISAIQYIYIIFKKCKHLEGNINNVSVTNWPYETTAASYCRMLPPTGLKT